MLTENMFGDILSDEASTLAEIHAAGQLADNDKIKAAADNFILERAGLLQLRKQHRRDCAGGVQGA